MPPRSSSRAESSSAVPRAERSAVIVVDFQNDYCHPDGAMAKMGNDVSGAGAVAASVSALLDVARLAEVPCILVRTTHGPWTNTPGWLSRGSGGDTLRLEQTPLVTADTWGAEFFVITPQPADLVLTKHRYSAFAYTALELALDAKQRDCVVLAGTMTNACVEATAVDAVMRGYRAFLVEDCTATSSTDVQEQSVAKFAALIGPVVDLAAVKSAWT